MKKSYDDAIEELVATARATSPAGVTQTSSTELRAVAEKFAVDIDKVGDDFLAAARRRPKARR